MALKKEGRGRNLDAKWGEVDGGTDVQGMLVGGGIPAEKRFLAKGCLSRGRGIKKKSVSWGDGIVHSVDEVDTVGGGEVKTSDCGLGGDGGDEGLRGRRDSDPGYDDGARREGAGFARKGVEWVAVEQGEGLDQVGEWEGEGEGEREGEWQGDGEGEGEGDSRFAAVQDKLASLQSRMDALQMEMRQVRRDFSADGDKSLDQASDSARGGSATWRVAMSLSTARCASNALVIAGCGAQLHDE